MAFPIFFLFEFLTRDYSSSMMMLIRSILKEHTKGRRVHVWTVNDKSKARELFINDMDGIFTDEPASMQEVLRKFHPR